MNLHPLPANVLTLLDRVSASSRLVAHLTLVHDAAIGIIDVLLKSWPDLTLDRDAVLFGAATHDIGKALYPSELIHPGTDHELAGVNLLVSLDVPQNLARFARTHATWSRERDCDIEDLVVALADKAWKGARDDQLELALAKRIAEATNESLWQVYAKLDDLITPLANDAHAKLIWQAQYST